MGSEMNIPCLNFCKEGSEGWKDMSKKVREACESHGCFILIMCDDDGISMNLREEMFMSMRALFDLPEETKKKHTSQKPYRGYHGKCPFFPFFESFGIDDAPLSVTAQAFTNLMWPQGNPTFCETIKSMSSKMLELSFLILKMILEGYELPQHYISNIESMKSTSDLRLIKYQIPKSNNASDQTALLAHTDKSTITILCQNEIQGLQVQSKSGKWIEVNIPQEGLVVFVGDILKAWSNGRLHSPMHRVVMSGEKERLSFGLFAIPKDEVEIEVPHELVDNKLHPQRYRPFKYGEYFNYYASTLKEDALEALAGV